MAIASRNRRPAPDPQLPAPAYVVLGMVRLGARSGYEIKRTVMLSIRFFWTISEAQIYPSLQLLEREGMVQGKDEPRGRRPRRVYEITERGERLLRDWLGSEQPMPFELRDIGLLKLFFADVLLPQDALGLLDAIKHRSQDRVDTLQAIKPDAESAEAEGTLYPLLTLEMGIAFHQAMVDVCREFEGRLQA